jgi:hypothetical protein
MLIVLVSHDMARSCSASRPSGLMWRQGPDGEFGCLEGSVTSSNLQQYTSFKSVAQCVLSASGVVREDISEGSRRVAGGGGGTRVQRCVHKGPMF